MEHDLHSWDIEHLVREQMGVSGQPNGMDHEKKPLRHDRDVDDLHDLLYRCVDHLYRSNWGTAMVTRTMVMSLCVTKGVSTTMMNCNCGISAVFCTSKSPVGTSTTWQRTATGETQ